MKEQLSDEELNRLLAQPAQLADRGFSKRVQSNLVNSESRRMRVFAAIAVAWIMVVLLAGSPEQLWAALSFSGFSWEGIVASLTQSLPIQDSVALQLISNSSLVGSVITVLLAIVIAQKLGEE